MRREPLANLVEEISDRLRNAARVSDAAEHALQTDSQAPRLAQLCEEAVSLERVAAMLRVLGHVCAEGCSHLAQRPK